MSRTLTVAALLASLLALTVQPAQGSRFLKVGLYDESQTLYGPVDKTFPILKALNTQVLRTNLYWGGRFGVASGRPAHPADPADPAYDWGLYDRLVDYAAQYGIAVVFSVYGTPGWANGGKGLNAAPLKPLDLRNFAYAAARRYSGTFPDAEGKPLPPVRRWLAWNEPNNPVFLAPQFRRAGSTWVVQSAVDYAKICNAVYSGVHGTLIAGEQVACGVTAPRGNNQPRSDRPSVSPVAFLRAAKKAGMKSFDAYAHHPYYGSNAEGPTTRPPQVRGADPTAVTLANIGTLISEVTRLYGPKRIWITEYGYQTNPPDALFGVSWAKQALYLKEAFAIARRNPRIDMMLWFLLKDEPTLGGWQSGFYSAAGKRKPSFTAFQGLPR